MTTIRYSDYREPALGDLAPGTWAAGGSDRQLFNAAVWCFAHARRNLMCMHPNADGWPGLIVGTPGTGDWVPWIEPVDISGRIVRPGKLKVNLWCAIVNALDTNAVEVRVICGGVSDYFELRGAGDTTLHWESVELDLTGREALDIFRIDYRVRYGGLQSMQLYSCEAYQPEDDSIASLSWIDLSPANAHLATTDYPDGGLLNYILRNNLMIVRGSRVPKSNVYSHWLSVMEKTGSYGANNDDLGRYKIIKRRGITEMKVHLLIDDDGTDWILRVSLGGALTGGGITGGAGLQWVTLTYSGLASAETEYELLIDADDDGNGTRMSIPGVYVIESSGSSVSYTVPDPGGVGSRSGIRASQYVNLRDTLDHLWKEGGRNIVLGDWRVRDGTSYDVHACQALGYTKTDYQHQGANSSVIARALAFSSEGSTRIKVRCGWVHDGTHDPTTAQGLLMQLSDSLTTGTWIDVDPRYDGQRIIAHNIWHEHGTVDACELEIDSDDWEDETVSPEPAQVWIQAATDDAGEYLKPLWVSIEELPLMPPEFP